WMTGTIAARGNCPAPPLPYNAVLFCASAADSAVCAGDSGSALVNLAGPPTLLGVADAGATDCRPGSQAAFADVSAPQLLRFLEGDAHPPGAPEEPASTSVRISWRGSLVVGRTVTCSSTGWAAQGRLVYVVFANSVHRLGSNTTYRVRQEDA